MQAKTLIIAASLAAAIGFAAWDIYKPPPRLQIKENAIEKSVSKPMQDFSMTDMQGRNISLSDFKGKTVLINIWATWCAPCKVEFPDLINIAKTRKDDLVLLALSVDSQPNKIAPFLQGIVPDIGNLKNVHIIPDKAKAISQETLGVVRYPETFVVAPDQSLQRKIVGALTKQDIQALLPQ